MLKSWVRLCVGGMMCLILVGCSSSGVSEKQLKEDILSLEEAVGIGSNVESLTIVEKTLESDTENLKINAVIDYSDYTMTLDLQMNYTKDNGRWVLSDHVSNILSVVPKNNPTLSIGFKDTYLALSEQLIQHEVVTDKAPVYTITSNQTDLEHGTATIITEENYTILAYTIHATYTIEATYVRNKGWTYVLKDWVLVETMDWNGIYDLKLTEDTSQWPGSDPNEFYHLNEQIEGIDVTGIITATKSMEHPDGSIVESSVRIRYVYDGQDIDVTPSEIITPTYFIFEPTSNDRSQMAFELLYNAFANYEPRYHVLAGAFDGTLIKRP